MKIFLFENVHKVMQAENKLIAAGVPCEMLPTPRAYSSDCGMCLGVEDAFLSQAQGALAGIRLRAVTHPEDPKR